MPRKALKMDFAANKTTAVHYVYTMHLNLEFLQPTNRLFTSNAKLSLLNTLKLSPKTFIRHTCHIPDTSGDNNNMSCQLYMVCTLSLHTSKRASKSSTVFCFLNTLKRQKIRTHKTFVKAFLDISEVKNVYSSLNMSYYPFPNKTLSKHIFSQHFLSKYITSCLVGLKLLLYVLS